MENVNLEKLKQLCKGSSKRYKQIAEDIGMFPQNLSLILNGSRPVGIATVIKFADYFNTSLDWLYDRDTERHGMWVITHDYDDIPEAMRPLGRVVRCSVCGYPNSHIETNYCPYCGARMTNEQQA